MRILNDHLQFMFTTFSYTREIYSIFFYLILLYGFLFRLWGFISIKIQIVYVRVATYYTEEKIDILHHLWYTFSKLMV